MAGFTTDVKELYADSNIVSRFVLWNIGVFLVLRIVGFVSGFFFEMEHAIGDSYYYLSLPSQPLQLLTKPWTILTHMFTHWDFMHILFNMLWLWFGGRILLDVANRRQFVKAYWVGGFAGMLLYLIIYNLIPEYTIVEGSLIGASGAVHAVWLTAAATAPNYKVHLPLVGAIKMYLLTLIFVIIALPMSRYNFGGILCHFGGAFFGYWYGRNLAAGVDRVNWFDNAYERVLSWFRPRKKRSKLKVVKGGKYSRDDYEYNEQKKEDEATINAILDKISKSGYESLTKKEKAILHESSNKP